MFRPQPVTPNNGQSKPNTFRRNRGGRRRQFTAAQHAARGTYRADRHGEIEPKPEPKAPLCNRPVPLLSEHVPRKWIRSPADEAAVKAGYRFDRRQGQYAIAWIETNLQLVEGVWSGRPFILMPWQRDFLMRLFGWLKFSEEWGRPIMRFRRALVMVPKKNGKSPFAAALSLLLAYGFHQPDQMEMGAEVIIVAKDKIQTDNIFKHCRRMVKTQPALADICAINQQQSQILNTHTDTLVRALAHDPDQLEGLNPRAMLCDELHVWKNQRTWDAIRYAGASRPDFLLMAITTAGEDRQNICYGQYEYAHQVNSGVIEDPEFLGVIYEADEEDDWTRPAVWRKANPSLGYTIKESEMKSACTEAKHNARLQNAFRRYRLNIWTQPEAAWLDHGYWTDCIQPITLADAAGFTCSLALDLSKTRDLTAAAITWHNLETDLISLWVQFWLPEETARRRNHQIPFLEWAKAGHVKLTPGDTVDYGIVCDDLKALTEQLYIGTVIYDPWNAEHLTQQITDNLGIERVKFPQTISNFNAPSKEFERRIINGHLAIAPNPCLTWQAGHVLIYTDPSGNIRPVRRENTDHRTIDGIVAGIMSLAQTLRETPPVSFSFTLE